MTVRCKIGHKTGIKCDHKRNDGKGGVICAINATPEICVYAEEVKEK